MDTEQQRQWAYIAMRASAVPPRTTQAEITKDFKDQAVMPYKFEVSPAVQRIVVHPRVGEHPSNPELAIRLLAHAMDVKIVTFDK